MATFSGRQRRCWRGRGLTGPLHPTGLKRVQALPDSRNGQGCGPRTSQGPVAEDPPHHRHIGSRERTPHGATADGEREGARHFADAVLLGCAGRVWGAAQCRRSLCGERLANSSRHGGASPGCTCRVFGGASCLLHHLRLHLLHVLDQDRAPPAHPSTWHPRPGFRLVTTPSPIA